MARVAHIFGKRLAEAREELAMTQRELGEAIGGVSDETISRIERHEVAGILAKRLPKLASALHLSFDDFKARFCVSELAPGGASVKAAGSYGHQGVGQCRGVRTAGRLGSSPRPSCPGIAGISDWNRRQPTR